MFLKRLSLGFKYYIEELKVQKFFWTRLANFSQSGLISDPLMVSKFHNGIYDPKGQENRRKQKDKLYKKI